MNELAHKSVVLTGASAGLGAALAEGLAAAGGRLTLMARDAGRLEAVAAQCQRLGAEAQIVSGDVTRPDDCGRAVEAAAARFGGVDYMLCNAGLSMWARFEDVVDMGVFRRLMEVNYLGTVHCIHHALPHLKKSRGMAVAVSSIQGRIGVPLHTGYVAAKHAVQGFCTALRLELAGSGVDVLTVLPHWLKGTDLRQSALGGDGQSLGAQSRRHSSESVDVAEASRLILEAMRQRRRELIFPWKLKALVALNALAPKRAEAIILRAVRKQDAS